MVKSTSGAAKTGEIARGPQKKQAAPPPKQPPLAAADEFLVLGRIVDKDSKKPVSGAKYQLLDGTGKRVAEGRTDYTGGLRHPVAKGGSYKVKVEGAPKGGDEGSVKAVAVNAKEKQPTDVPVKAPKFFIRFAIKDYKTKAALDGVSYEVVREGTVVGKGASKASEPAKVEVAERGKYVVRAGSGEEVLDAKDDDKGPPVDVLVWQGKVAIRAEDGKSDPPKAILVTKAAKFKAVPDPATQGAFKWTAKGVAVSDGAKDDGDVFAVAAGPDPSAAEGAGSVEVVFTPAGGKPLAPVKVAVTVVKIEIKAEDGKAAAPKLLGAKSTLKLKAVITPAIAGAWQWKAGAGALAVDGDAAKDAVALKAGDAPSGSADAEKVEVVFTPAGGPALPAVEAKLTVIAVAIKAEDGKADPPRAIGKEKTVKLKAVPAPALPGGAFKWTTASKAATLSGEATDTVAVKAGAAASAAEGAEALEVVYTPADAPALAPAKIGLTVLEVAIRAADGKSAPGALLSTGKGLKLQAVLSPAVEGGAFKWTTKSDKATLALADADKATVALAAGAKPSAAADAESVEVVYTPKGAPALDPVAAKLAVVKLEVQDLAGKPLTKHVYRNATAKGKAVLVPAIAVPGMYSWEVTGGTIALAGSAGASVEVKATKASAAEGDGVLKCKLKPDAGGVELEGEHKLSVLALDMLLDADRDGKPDPDPTGLDAWEWGAGKKGAVILCNNDDDDAKKAPDNSDEKVNGADDVADTAPLVLRPGKVAFPKGWTAVLAIDPPAKNDKIRVFDARAAGKKEVLGKSTAAEYTIANLDTFKADVEYGMEATQYPDAAFDGELGLTFKVKDPGGVEVSAQKAKVRVAPWLMFNHLDPTEVVYVANLGAENAAFRTALSAAVRSAGVPAPTEANAAAYEVSDKDRWTQDIMEIGHSSIPGTALPVVLRTASDRSLSKGATYDTYPRKELLGKNFGWTQAVAPLAGSSLDSFGNLDCSPPCKSKAGKEYKFGRIIYGIDVAGARRMHPDVMDFLIAQKVQEPIQIDVSWLRVGHVDEYLSFIPCPGTTHGFKMVLAGPKLAMDIIDREKAAGNGAAKLYDGLPAAKVPAANYPLRTVAAVAGDAAFRAVQTTCQGSIDAVRAILESELGLDPKKDVIEFPVLFRNAGGIRHLASTADAVNMLVVTKAGGAGAVLCVPKPFGPVVGGACQFEKAIKDALAGSGCTPAFIDDFSEYHNLSGEIHCGTNSKRKPPAGRSWWEQVP